MATATPAHGSATDGDARRSDEGDRWSGRCNTAANQTARRTGNADGSGTAHDPRQVLGRVHSRHSGPAIHDAATGQSGRAIDEDQVGHEGGDGGTTPGPSTQMRASDRSPSRCCRSTKAVGEIAKQPSDQPTRSGETYDARWSMTSLVAAFEFDGDNPSSWYASPECPW